MQGAALLLGLLLAAACAVARAWGTPGKPLYFQMPSYSPPPQASLSWFFSATAGDGLQHPVSHWPRELRVHLLIAAVLSGLSAPFHQYQCFHFPLLSKKGPEFKVNPSARRQMTLTIWAGLQISFSRLLSHRHSVSSPDHLIMRSRHCRKIYLCGSFRCFLLTLLKYLLIEKCYFGSASQGQTQKTGQDLDGTERALCRLGERVGGLLWVKNTQEWVDSLFSKQLGNPAGC